MSKVITKGELIYANNKASKTKGRYLEPEFLESIPENLWYIVDEALPFPERHGFVRCWVGIGTTFPATEDGFDSYLMDLPEHLYESLTEAVELLPTHK